MTRRDGLLKLLEEYDDLASIMLSHPCYDRQWCQKIFTYLRQKKEKLYQELIEHECNEENQQMKIFKKINTGTIDLEKVKAPIEETPSPTPKLEEEWVWVEGYKGTDFNMCCRGYQYELGVQYNMPEGAKIEECKNGFHLCLYLSDICNNFYRIGNGNRFFRVKALIRKSDKDKYHRHIQFDNGQYITTGVIDKLVAKSIIFTSELTYDEILKNTDAEDLTDEYKKMAIYTSVETAVNEYQLNTLLEDGYSKPFAAHIIKINKFDIAHAFGSQNDLSIDMKVLGILYN